MKVQIHIHLFAAALLAVTVSPLRAQLVADGAASTLSDVTNFFNSSVTVGTNGSSTLLVLANNCLLTNTGVSEIGRNATAKLNEVQLVSATARWLMLQSLSVGLNGSFNRLTLNNGAQVADSQGTIGNSTSASNNTAVISGAGSFWNNQSDLIIGQSGRGNRLVVSDSATVACSQGAIGNSSSASNNIAEVSGIGSFWNNQSDLYVGQSGGGNWLVVSNGATVTASNLFIGFQSSSTNNRLVVDSGTLLVTNAAGNGVLEIRRGTNVLNSGWVEADILHVTGGPQGVLEFNGGTLSAKSSRIFSGTSLRIGNGGASATMILAGNGVHDATGTPDVKVSSNAVLTGNGTLVGGFSILSGGALVPGGSVGKMTFSNAPSLQGAVVVEISKNGASLTNDQIEVAGPLTYGGTLVVSNLGPTALAAGDKFRLFVASIYAGEFSSIALPALGPDLSWADNLLADGSIEVVFFPPGDHFWTNALGGSYQVGGNWLLHSVPGPQDNAVFTNNASYPVNMLSINPQIASAVFNAANGTVTQNLASSSWTLTNSYVVGRDASSTAAVTHVTGALLVTNAAGNAPLIIGAAGRGTFNLDGGDVTADFLFVTNNNLTFTNSTFNFNFGNLTTLQGSVVTQNTSFVIGSASSQTATWTMRRGTNVIAMDDSSQTVLGNSPGSRGLVVASGSSTVWSNSGSLLVGNFGSGSQMIVSNGANLFALSSAVGSAVDSSNNVATVTGSGSLWSNQVVLAIGEQGSGNRLVVNNGGRTHSIVGHIGELSSSTNNEAVVAGPGSVWTIPSTLFVGNLGNGNRLVVTNGGRVENIVTYIGLNASSSDNEALVTGAGSILSSSSILAVGQSGSSNRLVVSNGGEVSTEGVILGNDASSTNNRVVVDGGTLRATNVAGVGFLDVRRGTTVLNAGMIEADIVRMTNAPKGILAFNGGTLSAKSSTISSGTILSLGNGVGPATMFLAGNGVHNFGGNLLVMVSSNAVLTGNGTLIGGFTISSGGKLIPGASIGKMIFSNSPALQGAVIMEISKNGATLTNDQIQAAGALTYGGTLTVSNLGPTTLAIGDRFPLFSATSYTGAFSVVSLPSLPAGLNWTNKMLLDGSIEVVAGPQFKSVALYGTNLIVTGTGGTPNASYSVLASTNVALPLSNWVSIATNQFDSSGIFSFTNPITPGEPQRYFRLRTP